MFIKLTSVEGFLESAPVILHYFTKLYCIVSRKLKEAGASHDVGDMLCECEVEV